MATEWRLTTPVSTGPVTRPSITDNNIALSFRPGLNPPVGRACRAGAPGSGQVTCSGPLYTKLRRSRPLIHPGSDRKQRVDHPIRFPGLPTHPALLWEGRLKFLYRIPAGATGAPSSSRLSTSTSPGILEHWLPGYAAVPAGTCSSCPSRARPPATRRISRRSGRACGASRAPRRYTRRGDARPRCYATCSKWSRWRVLAAGTRRRSWPSSRRPSSSIASSNLVRRSNKCETGTKPGSLDSTQVEQEHSQRLDSFVR